MPKPWDHTHTKSQHISWNPKFILASQVKNTLMKVVIPRNGAATRFCVLYLLDICAEYPCSVTLLDFARVMKSQSTSAATPNPLFKKKILSSSPVYLMLGYLPDCSKHLRSHTSQDMTPWKLKSIIVINETFGGDCTSYVVIAYYCM